MAPSRPSSIREDIINLPNLLTLGRIAVIPVVCWLIVIGTVPAALGAAALFGLAAFTDWLDGYIARKQNLVSMTGKFLDPLADKLLVMSVLCTLLALGEIPLWFVVVSLAREMSITGLRALAAGEGIIIAAGSGGKFKTGFQLAGLIGMLLGLAVQEGVELGGYLITFSVLGFALLLVSLGFSLTSGWAYVRSFFDSIESQPSPGASAAE